VLVGLVWPARAQAAELTLAPELFSRGRGYTAAAAQCSIVSVLSVSARESCLSVKNDDASVDKNSDW